METMIQVQVPHPHRDRSLFWLDLPLRNKAHHWLSAYLKYFLKIIPFTSYVAQEFLKLRQEISSILDKML
jgi:hypothetical protein